MDESADLLGTVGPRQSFILVLEGYEGPLDLLLELARRQKVDLRAISILELAEQYLTFIERARRLEIELAADYLLMAAWLAYLKSGMLLPPDEEERLGAEEAAALLQSRIALLEAMRRAGERLLARPRLGRDFFPCGFPQSPVVRRESVWDVAISDLLQAYARVQAREHYAPLHLQRPPVVSMEEAMLRLRDCIPGAAGWQSLAAFLPEGWRDAPLVRSAIGSLFTGALEMVRTGDLEIRQERAFAPIFLKGRKAAGGKANGGL